MRLTNAVAVALTGWYLMMPQVQNGEIGPFLAPDKPNLAEWKQVGSYDTAADCETARQQLVLENTDNPSIPIDYNALGEQAKALVSLETSAGIWDIDF